MWAEQAWGVYRMQDRIDFKANGEAVHVHHVEGPSEDPRRVTLSWGGNTETFDLVVRETAPGNFQSAPVFELRHADAAKSFSTSRDCSM